ncbi:hypothetical protein ES703_48929 [subsurface metagenome]
MFSTKQIVLILITEPFTLLRTSRENSTVRDIDRGLREHFGIIRTRRHIRRLIQELDQEGIIRRQIRSCQPRPFGSQDQATRYEIVDFYRAFQNDLSLLDQAKLILARERRRRKRKEARA